MGWNAALHDEQDTPKAQSCCHLNSIGVPDLPLISVGGQGIQRPQELPRVTVFNGRNQGLCWKVRQNDISYFCSPFVLRMMGLPSHSPVLNA